jgi:hypothetical protein
MREMGTGSAWWITTQTTSSVVGRALRTCVVDFVDGVRDEFSDTCEKVYQTASIPQE